MRLTSQEEYGLRCLLQVARASLFERTVSIYAELIDTNAYHQPGVEAGKKAALAVLTLQQKLLAALGSDAVGVEQLAMQVDADAADCWPILQHLARNRDEVTVIGGYDPRHAKFLRC